jgi:hypothetical protein
MAAAGKSAAGGKAHGAALAAPAPGARSPGGPHAAAGDSPPPKRPAVKLESPPPPEREDTPCPSADGSEPPAAPVPAAQQQLVAAAPDGAAAVQEFLRQITPTIKDLDRVVAAVPPRMTMALLLRAVAKGTLPAWLAAVAVGRDGALVGGALLSRAAALGWRWRGAREFFRMVPGAGDSNAPAAPPVEPLLVSKVNTALTFALVAAALAHDGWGVPDAEALAAGAAAVGATTAMSGGAYLVLFLRKRAGLPPPA